MACGIGCGIVVLLAFAVIAYIGYQGKLMFEKAEAAIKQGEEAQERQSAATSALMELDETHPATLAEEPGLIALTDADVDAYLALHAGLADAIDANLLAADALEDLETGMDEFVTMEEKGEQPKLDDVTSMFGMLGDMVSIGLEAELSEARFLEESARVMGEQGIGPAQLRRLRAAIDWFFLKREGLSDLALPDGEMEELEEARSLDGYWSEYGIDKTEEDAVANQKEWDGARAAIARLEAKIESSQGLNAGTLAVLERRRSELEAVTDERALALGAIQEAVSFASYFGSWDEVGEESSEDSTGDAAGSE